MKAFIGRNTQMIVALFLVASIFVIIGMYPDEAPTNPFVYCYAMFAMMVGPVALFYAIVDKVENRRKAY